MEHDERREAGWVRLRAQSFVHAAHGVRQLGAEPNARIHAAVATLVLVLSAVAHLAPVEWALMLFAIALVFTAEALNTAVEHLADAAVPTRHPLVGAAKDLAAGAVLIAAVLAAVIGLLVLGPHLFALGRGAG